MSATELLWLAHTTTIENLRRNKPGMMRLYLTQTMDYTALREWDNSQMKDTGE